MLPVHFNFEKNAKGGYLFYGIIAQEGVKGRIKENQFKGTKPLGGKY